jgi:hypothetical protein
MNDDGELLYFLKQPELKVFYRDGKTVFRELKIISSEPEEPLVRYYFDASAPFKSLIITGGMMDQENIACDYNGVIKLFRETSSMDLFSTTSDINTDLYTGYFYDSTEKGFYLFTKDKEKNLELWFIDSATSKKEFRKIKQEIKNGVNEITVQTAVMKFYFYAYFYENIKPCIYKTYYRKNAAELNALLYGPFSNPYLKSITCFHRSFIDWKSHEIISIQINNGDTSAFYSDGISAYKKLNIASYTFFPDTIGGYLDIEFKVSFLSDITKIYTLRSGISATSGNDKLIRINPDLSLQYFDNATEADTSLKYSGVIKRIWLGNYSARSVKASLMNEKKPYIIYKVSGREIILTPVNASWDSRVWLFSYPGDKDKLYRINLEYNDGSVALYITDPSGNMEILRKE